MRFTVHRKNTRAGVVLLVFGMSVCLFGLIACGVNLGPQQQAPKSQTYTLEYPPPTPSPGPPLSYILRIEPIEAIPFYRTDKMVYREAPFRREAYRYHKWQAPPGEMVTYLLLRDLRAAGIFSAVLSPDSLLAPTHSLEGGIEEFPEEDSPKGWLAVLTLNVTLAAEYIPEQGRTVLFQHTYSEREPCASNTPGALAEAMSRAMSRISARILEDVRGAVENAD